MENNLLLLPGESLSPERKELFVLFTYPQRVHMIWHTVLSNQERWTQPSDKDALYFLLQKWELLQAEECMERSRRSFSSN